MARARLGFRFWGFDSHASGTRARTFFGSRVEGLERRVEVQGPGFRGRGCKREIQLDDKFKEFGGGGGSSYV